MNEIQNDSVIFIVRSQLASAIKGGGGQYCLSRVAAISIKTTMANAVMTMVCLSITIMTTLCLNASIPIWGDLVCGSYGG